MSEQLEQTIAGVSKYVTYDKDRFELAIKDFDKTNIYENNMACIARADETKSVALNYALVNGRRSTNEDDVREFLKQHLNIIRVTTDPYDCLSADTMPSLRVYDYDRNQWYDNSVFIEYVIQAIAGAKPQIFYKTVFDSLARDFTIPLISNTADTVANRAKSYYEKDNKQYFDIEVDFANGRYNTKTKQLQQIKPSTLSLDPLPYSVPQLDIHDEQLQKRFKLFDEYFDSASGKDAHKAITMKQVALCALLNINPGKQAINLLGQAGTGKSTFLSLITELAGGKQHIASLDYGKFNKDDMLELIGDKRLVIGRDNDDKVVVKALATLKTLLSHEPFTYSRKFKSAETNIFKGLVLQAFNDAPKFLTGGSNQPILDRMLLIEMNTRFRNTENDNRNLENELIKPTNLGYMALYLLETVEYFTKFHEPNVARKAEVLGDSNILEDFLAELSQNGAFANTIIPLNHLRALYNDETGQNIGVQLFNARIEHTIAKYGYEISTTKYRYISITNKQLYNPQYLADYSDGRHYAEFNKIVLASEARHSVINKSIVRKLLTVSDIEELINNKELTIENSAEIINTLIVHAKKSEDDPASLLETQAIASSLESTIELDDIEHYCKQLIAITKR